MKQLQKPTGCLRRYYIVIIFVIFIIGKEIICFRVQVEDEDFYDGLDDESEYESDDSNGIVNSCTTLSPLVSQCSSFFMCFSSVFLS